MPIFLQPLPTPSAWQPISGSGHVNPFGVTVYDKDFGKRGTIGAPQALTVTPRHNQQPTAQLVVAATDPRLGDLMSKGARVVITYRGEHLVGGRADSLQGQGPFDTSSFTFQVADDWTVSRDMLAWPNPASAVTAQAASEYDTLTGPAETVFKAIVSANLGHGNPGVLVAADLGRGATITVANRFHPLTDRLMPLVDAAGIGTTVRQSGTDLVVDCYATTTYPRTLTERSGVVQDWAISSNGPKATRVIVGGKGEGTARVFRQRIDAALEAEYGYSIEAFKDATDADTDAELDLRGDQFLAENGPTSGISVKLSETSTFRYDPTGAAGVRVGDVVTLEVGPGVVVTDVLRECTLSWSVEQGLQVTPQVGERRDDPSSILATALRQLTVAVRTLGRR